MITDILKKYEIKKDTLIGLSHVTTDPNQLQKIQACLRFINEFIGDLKDIDNKYQPTNENNLQKT